MRINQCVYDYDSILKYMTNTSLQSKVHWPEGTSSVLLVSQSLSRGSYQNKLVATATIIGACLLMMQRRERSSVHMSSDDRKIEMADKTKRKTSAVQKKAYTPDVVLSRSVHTEHDKAVKNHFKFVSICHKLNAEAVFCHAASSVDSITDY